MSGPVIGIDLGTTNSSNVQSSKYVELYAKSIDMFFFVFF